MKLTPLDIMETYVSKVESHSVDVAELAPGVHSTPHAFFKKEKDGTIPWVVSRVCDHAGGQLRICETDGSKAICPLHNWEFDFETLSYSKIPNQTFEHITKNSLPYRVNGSALTYETEELRLRVPQPLLPKQITPAKVTTRFIMHASVMMEFDGLKLLTDPWFVGECLAGGWWLKYPPKADAWELLNAADMLYISHNHPDHLHAETLAHARRDIPIIVPQFESSSVATPLRSMGFTNVIELERKRLYRLNDSDLLISILPTGDHREDSGLFIMKGDFTTVHTVDCVGANHYILPENVTLLLTNFAGGASGWPLCYDVVGSLDERAKIVTKNRGSMTAEVMKYLNVTRPKGYMPYAGFFDEKAPRDKVIQEYNIKNSTVSIIQKIKARFPDTYTIDTTVNDVLTWENGKFTTATIDQPPLFEYDATSIEGYLAAQRSLLKYFDIEKVARYFNQSEFKDQLILYLILTDDDYEPNGESLRIDFSTDPISHRVVDGAALVREFDHLEELGDYHHLLLKARRDSMWQIVYFGRPLEELSLGFQCRIDRKPDQYNAAFWKHYTTFGAPMLLRGEDYLLDKLMEGVMA